MRIEIYFSDLYEGRDFGKRSVILFKKENSVLYVHTIICNKTKFKNKD